MPFVLDASVTASWCFEDEEAPVAGAEIQHLVDVAVRQHLALGQGRARASLVVAPDNTSDPAGKERSRCRAGGSQVSGQRFGTNHLD